MRQATVVLLAAVATATLFSLPAHAHVMVRDTTGSAGAILHIVPDDDPIAGKQATLYLDMQQNIEGTSTVALTIANDQTGDEISIETNRDKSLVTAKYTFPSQGIYHLRYQVISTTNTYVFEETTRVSRGVATSPQILPRYTWAEALLFVCAVLFAIAFIVAFNRRKLIAKHSTF